MGYLILADHREQSDSEVLRAHRGGEARAHRGGRALALLHERYGARHRGTRVTLPRASPAASGQNFLLVLYDRLLVSNDFDLIGDDQCKAILVTQDPVLVGDDVPLVRHYLQLILGSGLRHWLFPFMVFDCGVIAGSSASTMVIPRSAGKPSTT